ncbi:MAG: glycosyltransferase family 2 protein [bacterium]|nr:glycosyltransferase family 2 protein [bacterium]
MGSEIKLSVSLVVFNHSFESIQALVHTVLNLPFAHKLFIIDNSPTDHLSSQLPQKPQLQYVFTGENLGYGGAHNLAIRKILNQSSYHLVVNPDIVFEGEALVQMMTFLDQSPNIGLLMPKVLYGSGEIQYLCKLFPTPFDLIMRRFIPGFLKNKLQYRLNQYELKHKDYNKQMEVPNLSGCFMLLRVDVLKIVGLFDERFFMYLEDTDLSRRINNQFQTMYYPEVSIIHKYEKGSYKVFKLLVYHIQSAFKYFNKYGWFFDPVRTTINGNLK